MKPFSSAEVFHSVVAGLPRRAANATLRTEETELGIMACAATRRIRTLSGWAARFADDITDFPSPFASSPAT